jgi:histidyl-tRNA synthetase
MADTTQEQRIEPRTLRGFRDYLPEVMIPRERCMEVARTIFRSYGFAPIDTPALEYFEILTGKGSEETDRQMYHFTHADRHVGMRFDLTVPLARFAAQHIATLGTPFKRYHIAPVWRGESPQAGRYREFVQCDFDTIGTTGPATDTETVLVIHDLLTQLGFDRFTIHLNSRQVLQGLLLKLELADRSTHVLRGLDKLGKIGADGVAKEFQATAQLSRSQCDAVLQLSQIAGSPADVLAAADSIAGDQPMARDGIDRLRTIIDAAHAAGVASERLKIDVSIARGLDYYTGVVFETLLDDLPSIGSVCSGGRYDNLAGLFTKEHLPGVGASLGLDRLLAAMEQLKMLPATRTPAPVMIAYFDAARLNDYVRLASHLRQHGVGCELYPEAKKLGAQLKYADQRGFRIGIIAGSREFDSGVVQVKDLLRKIGTDVAWDGHDVQPLVTAIDRLLKLDSAIA